MISCKHLHCKVSGVGAIGGIRFRRRVGRDDLWKVIHDPSSRLWCQGIRSTMMSDRQSYSCSEVTANLWASALFDERFATLVRSEIRGRDIPMREELQPWMFTCRRLRQSSGASRLGPLTDQALRTKCSSCYKMAIMWAGSPIRRFVPT